MGWCQAELARQLKCEVDLIFQYETGEATVAESHHRILSSALWQADSAAEKTLRRPVADALMRTRGVSQIHDFDVVETIAASDFAL